MTAPAAPVDIAAASRLAEVPNARKGILLMIAGLALFSILNALVKSLAEHFPLTQIVFFRNAIALIPLLALTRSLGGFGALQMKAVPLQFLQGFMFTMVLLFMFFAYRHMPLADATAIAFAQPLIVLALSAPLLGERVTRLGWIAVAVGFSGVLLMAQPTGNVTYIGVASALIGTVFAALSLLLQRHLSRTETSISIVFWTLAFSGLLMLPTLFWSFVPPTPFQWLLLIGNGLASGLCQYLTTRAVYHAPAATIAPISYTKMIWAIALGVFWFGDIPGFPVMLGSIIVMFAGYLVFRQTGLAVKPA